MRVLLMAALLRKDRMGRLLLWVCLGTLPAAALADEHEMLCSEGFGSFTSRSAAGVTVSVEPVRKSAFASRVCSASLSWKSGDVAVTPKASEINIDAFGVDLGLGPQVAAFEIRNVGSDKLVQYEIYALKKPAEKLRTLTGGTYFTAADTDMDGRVEIWTDDAGAMDGFENLPLSSFDAAPTVVLRFEKQKLMDVSAEFQPDYDRQIKRLESELDAGMLGRFKKSDGKLADRSAFAIDEAHGLTATKIKVLEIVWAYLYSGREPEAWAKLASLWPDADMERIKAAIQKAREAGMRSRVDGVAEHAAGFHVKKHAMVFDAETEYEKRDAKTLFLADTVPQEILLRRPALSATAQASLHDETVLYLTVDAAGKVRSAKAEGHADKDLLAATLGWRFIPAFKDGHAVASHMRYGVTPNQ